MKKIWDFLNTRGKDNEGKYRKMHTSNYAFYRKCTVVFVIVTLYSLAFFIPYLIGFFNLINNTRLFFPATVNILGQYHRFIIPNYHDFDYALAQMGTITSLTQITDNLGCLVDDTGTYYDFLKPTSPHWYIYLGISFVTMSIIYLT